MEQDSFKIENIRSEITFKFEPTPHMEMVYLKFAVHYMTSEGVRMQYFMEWINYVNGEPRTAKHNNDSNMLNNQKERLQYLARHSIYNTEELHEAITKQLDHIISGGDNNTITPHTTSKRLTGFFK